MATEGMWLYTPATWEPSSIPSTLTCSRKRGMEVNYVDMDALQIQASRPIWDDFLAKNDPTGEYAALLEEILK